MSGDLMDKLYRVIDRKRGSYVDLLAEAVAIRSEKGDYRETRKIMSWVESKLRELDASTTLHEVGSIMVGGKKTDLPPVLIADIRSETSDVTLLVYGHLDVTADGGACKLTEENGVLFGKGVTDSKGPLLCWLNAIKSYREHGAQIPINIRFVVEAMKESGSAGLLKYLDANKGSLFNKVNYVCISDSPCQFSSKPVLTYGLRGCCKFKVTVTGGKVDLHSGAHGGTVAEPMDDVIRLLASLKDAHGRVDVPNFHDSVEDVTPEEERHYHRLSFDVQAFKRATGVDRLLHKEDKKRLLMHRSRFPSLTVHGIESGIEGPLEASDVIPHRVSATFTVRIVPNQTPTEVFHKLQLYLMYLFNKSQSPNELTIEMPVAVPPWLAKPEEPNFKAAARAVHAVYRQEPDFVREGSSIPVVRELQEASGCTVVLLPVGYGDHGFAQNRDKLDVKTFMDGTKVITAYIYELAKLSKLKKCKSK